MKPDMQKIARRLLRLVHAEIGNHGGILTDSATRWPTKSLIIKAAMEYGATYRPGVPKKVLVEAFDEVVGTRGWSRFPAGFKKPKPDPAGYMDVEQVYKDTFENTPNVTVWRRR